MNLQRIKYFATAAEELNFARAAERCFLSPSVFSRQIAALEAEWGIKLFERDKHHVSLTKEGEEFLKICSPFLKDAEETEKRLKMLCKQQKRVLRIGYVDGCPRQLLHNLSEYMQMVQEKHKEVDIKIEINAGGILFDSLMRETLDAAILLRMDIPQNQMNEIRSICIAPWRLCAAVSKKSPLAHKKSISIRDLDGMNLMTAWTEGISDFSPYIIRKFHLNGIEPRFTYFTHDMGELLMRAATGEGISLLTDAAVDRIVGDVSLVPIHDFNKEFEGVLCWKKKNQGIDFCDLANKLRQ